MRDWLRQLIWSVIGPFIRYRRVQYWPAWAAGLFELKTPKTTIAKSPSAPSGGSNINIIFDLLDQTAQIRGAIAECGVFRGASILAMGLYLEQNKIDKTIYGFDSFQGFDESVASEIALGGSHSSEKKVGGFGDTSLQFVLHRIKCLGLKKRIRLIPGFFKDALGKAPEEKYSFVHLDCDLYESYQICLNYFYPRMCRGGIILLDEYNDLPWPGCNKAVDEFLADKLETLTPIERDGFQKYFIRLSEEVPRRPE